MESWSQTFHDIKLFYVISSNYLLSSTISLENSQLFSHHTVYLHVSEALAEC